MQQQEIHKFLERYFLSNKCEIVDKQPNYMTVQLTIELDKELMNRPFYWHYLEKTGGVPNPSKLTLITDPQHVPADVKGELIHFGSQRLHQIFASTKKFAGFIRLYEEIVQQGHAQSPLYPWLCINAKISYQSDRKKDILLSAGLNLITGVIVEKFHERLLQIQVTPKIPDYSFTLSPLIKPKSGLLRLDSYIRRTFEGDDHTWAERAIERWEDDLRLLENFYQDMDDKAESYYTEKEALQNRYEPNITISIVNGGLFYLSNQAI